MKQKTTIAGIVGLIGSILTSLAIAFPNKSWSQVAAAIGLALTGANGVGNIYAAEDTQVIKKVPNHE